MAKRKIVKSENLEKIEKKVEETNVIDETFSEVIEEIENNIDKDIEIIPIEEVKETVNSVEEKTLVKNVKNNKKPLMFGYIWNGQEYD